MGRRSRTATGGLGAAMVLLLGASCCITPPPAEKYFDRATPLGTTKLFQYAVETRQYPAAYSCLDPASREKYSESKFRLSLRFGKLEEMDNISPLEFFSEALRIPRDNSDDEAAIQFEYRETYSVIVVLVRYGGEWLIDLERTIGRMLGNPA